jgi:ATP-dependent RNA helicase DeaD
MPKEVSLIAKKFMANPTEVTVGHKNMGSENVSHEYFLVGARDRYQALKRLADVNPEIFSVIFCRTKRDTQKVAEQLIEDGYSAGALHGDLSQNQRDVVMKSFRVKQIQMLVATDVAARGIDVDDITHVINYQLPDEIETYTHRSGRTGRAGKSGISMVIVSRSEVRKIKSIEKIIKKEFTKKEVPSGMEICEVQLKALANKIHDTEINHEIDPYLNDINNLFKDVSKDELIKKFFSVEFTRFFNYYRKTKDLNSPNEGNHVQDYGKEDNSTRFFINIGNKDGYDWMKLKDFLRDTLQLSQDDVYKVDVKDSFAFFNTDNTHKSKVLEFFKDFKQDGRFINVEITEKKSRERNRGGGSRRSSGGYGSGRSRNERSKNSGFRSERKGRRGESGVSSKSPRRSSDFKPKGSTFSRPRKSRR